MCRGPRSKAFGLRDTAGTSAHTRKEKRKQVRRACEFCRKSKTGCSSFRPCQRCIQHGVADSCVDAPKKRRANTARSTPSPERATIAAPQPHPEEWSPCSVSSPSEEESGMPCDDRALDGMASDAVMAEAPPSALWNYLESIITRDEFSGGEYDEMWAKLTTDEGKWPTSNGDDVKESKWPGAAPTFSFSFQSNSGWEAAPNPSLAWGMDSKLVLPLLHSQSAPKLETEDSRTIAPLQLETTS